MPVRCISNARMAFCLYPAETLARPFQYACMPSRRVILGLQGSGGSGATGAFGLKPSRSSLRHSSRFERAAARLTLGYGPNRTVCCFPAMRYAICQIFSLDGLTNRYRPWPAKAFRDCCSVGQTSARQAISVERVFLGTFHSVKVERVPDVGTQRSELERVPTLCLHP